MTTPKQTDLFAGSACDLPLFSGTAPKAPETRPPTYQRRAPSLFAAACPICYGTGEVTTRKGKAPTRCTCTAGQEQDQD